MRNIFLSFGLKKKMAKTCFWPKMIKNQSFKKSKWRTKDSSLIENSLLSWVLATLNFLTLFICDKRFRRYSRKTYTTIKHSRPPKKPKYFLIILYLFSLISELKRYYIELSNFCFLKYCVWRTIFEVINKKTEKNFWHD